LARWTWAPDKARSNLAKHRVSFELAVRVFGDPMTVSRPDPGRDPGRVEERWQSIGRPSASSTVTLFVAHTDPAPQPDGAEEGRIISARLATAHERKAYEEGEF
jgi:uncharacterized protein